jgi:hypothetical protein
MVHVRDVKVKIAAVLRNEISIEDFARWIMSNSWNMHKDSSDVAVDLVSNIHLLLAERNAASNDDDFRNELSALLDEPNIIRISISISVDKVSPIHLNDPVASASLKAFPEILIPLPA